MSDKKELEKLTYTDLLPYNRTSFEPTEKFLKAIVDILLDHIKNSNDRDCKIVDFHHPKDLMEKFKFDVNENSQSLASLLDVCRESLHYQVKTGHPRFFNQISCGLDLISMAGEWLTATANTNMFTYEISPVFILMENEVLTKMRELIGWTDGDGIFCPGGAISNLYAIMAARHNRFPRSKALGASEIPPLAMFTSVDSHYSVKGAAGVCGIGTDYCFSIDVDSKGRMIPEELEAKIVECKNQGIMPFFVNCTMGTTVYGAFDPIQEIADICDRHHLWLHADAAWGGGLLMSNKHRHLLGGIERAHSVTWNPHKLLGVLLQCSAVLIKQEGLLFQCNQMSADYLFMQDKPYDVSYDTGDKVIQCGRHNDVFKFWLMWKAKGRAGFERQVNYLMDLRAYFVARIKETEGYTMVMEDCYKSVVALDVASGYETNGIQTNDLPPLFKIAPKIKAKMMSSGTTMVGYQPDKNYPNFFRMIISNPGITREDLDFLIDKIAEFGQDL